MLSDLSEIYEHHTRTLNNNNNNYLWLYFDFLRYFNVFTLFNLFNISAFKILNKAINVFILKWSVLILYLKDFLSEKNSLIFTLGVVSDDCIKLVLRVVKRKIIIVLFKITEIVYKLVLIFWCKSKTINRWYLKFLPNIIICWDIYRYSMCIIFFL